MKPRQSLFGIATVALAFLVASQASAQPAVATLFNTDGTGTLLSDNSAELLINRDGSVSANGTPTITVGDILVAIVGINTIGPTPIGAGTAPTYNEVTAMTITKIAAASDVDLGPAGPDDSFGVQNIDLWQFTAVPLDDGDVACVNWAAGTIDTTCSGGAEYTFPVLPGASNDGMLISAIFEDAGNNYDRDHGIQTGVTSATDGSLRLLVAIDPAKGDFLSVIAPLDLGGFGTVPPSTAIDNSNVSLDGTITYQNWPGLALDENITGGNGGLSSPIAGTSWPVFDNLDFTLTSAKPTVTIEKTPDFDDVPQPVFGPGDTACFDITVTNQGPGTATGVIIDDELATGDGYGPLSWYENPDLLGCDITPDTTYDKLHCDVGDLAENASFTVEVCADIPNVMTAMLLGASTFNATDGNLLLDNSEIPAGVGAPALDAKDWETFSPMDGSANTGDGTVDCGTPVMGVFPGGPGCAVDTPSGSTDNSYTQGAKEDDESPATDFGSIPPSKDDLDRWYYRQEPISNEVYLYLAWIRNNQLGTATIDFELNQSGDTAPNGVNPVRTEGDALITYDFLGGRVDEIGILRWLTAAGGHTAAECEANNSLPCWGNKIELLASGLAEGAVNFDDNGTNKPGDDGYSVYDPIENVTIEKERFGEAAINFTQAIGSADECLVFGQAFVKSRASGSSFTSELKDYIGPVPVNLSNCVEVPNTALTNWDNVPPEVSCETDNTYGACDDGGFFINSIAPTP